MNTQSCGIKEQVRNMVVEEIDFIDIKYTPVGCGQQAGCKGARIPRQRRGKIKAASDTILTGIEWECY
jgi:hypothetical protein